MSYNLKSNKIDIGVSKFNLSRYADGEIDEDNKNDKPENYDIDSTIHVEKSAPYSIFVAKDNNVPVNGFSEIP